MIIVKIIGGIGNQMFQFALYKALSKQKNCKLDVSELNQYLTKLNRMSIFQLFDLNYNVASKSEICSLGEFSFLDRFRKKFNIFPKGTYITEKEEGTFDLSLFDLDSAYLEGYWQSFKYFYDIRDEILAAYTFPPLDADNIEYVKLIHKYNHSVSIHIRMGDYLSSENNTIFGNICTEVYYEKAINILRDKYDDCHFFIFSNDTGSAIKLFSNLDPDCYTLVESNDEYNGWKDMYLMSLCRFNIIANSSFSWWSAWLNQHGDKVVIAPKKWLNTCSMPDICPDEWVRI